MDDGTHDDESGFEPLFNGRDLQGWVARPRVYGTVYPGGPHVLDAAPLFGKRTTTSGRCTIPRSGPSRTG